METKKIAQPAQQRAGITRGNKRSQVTQGGDSRKGQKTRHVLMNITSLVTHMNTRQEINLWPVSTRSGKPLKNMAVLPPK